MRVAPEEFLTVSTAMEMAPCRAEDAELLALVRSGETDALVALMQSNNQRLYRVARGILKDDADAEDVVQESYVRAFTHLAAFKGESSLATWLARIVTNEALGRLRRRRQMVDIAETLASDPCHTEPVSPESAAARQEIRRAIESAIDELPPAFRTVFIMRAIEQMSIEETAACLGILGETVKTRFHRANRLLRQALKAQFASILDDAFPFLGVRCERLIKRVLARLAIPS
jgi:RNA polymerase sigma-70 factor, ECF subfamily